MTEPKEPTESTEPNDAVLHPDPAQVFRCPVCDRVSYNKHDIAEGYCGYCHDWTGTNLVKKLHLLPPSPDKCQECAIIHKPEDPHNALSLFYQVKFKMEHGREPTWMDAISHCTPELQKKWIQALKERGIDAQAGRLAP